MANRLAGEAKTYTRVGQEKRNISVQTYTGILIIKFPHLLDSFLSPDDTMASYVSHHNHVLFYFQRVFGLYIAPPSSEIKLIIFILA